jgi:hypothetical protein
VSERVRERERLAHLSEEFLGATTGLYVHKSIMSVLDHPVSECTHTKLNQHPVVEDLHKEWITSMCVRDF